MNRMSSRQFLSQKQLFAILFVTLLDTGFISLPRWLITSSRQDGWISALIGAGIALIGLNILLFFMKHFPQMTFVQIVKKTFGKYLGTFFAVLISLVFLAYASVSIRILVDLVTTWLLPKTPFAMILLPMLLLSGYLIRNGLKVTGRFLELIFVLIIIILPVTLIPFFLKKNFFYFMPVGGTGLLTILKGVIPGFFTFFNFVSILILYPYVRQKASHKEIVKTANIAVLSAELIKVFFVFANIAVFGFRELGFFLYPMLEYVKLLSFPVLERTEFFMIFYWIFFMFSSSSIYLLLSSISFQQAFNLRGYKNISFIIMIPAFFITRFARNIQQTEQYVRYMGGIGFGILGSILFLLAIVLVLFKRKGSQNG